MRHQTTTLIVGLALVVGISCGHIGGSTSEAVTAGRASHEEQSLELVQQVLQELASFESVVSSGTFLLIVLVLALAGLGWVWITSALRRWQRLRGIAAGRLTVTTLIVQIVGALVASVIVFRQLFETVPIVSGIAIVVGGVVLIATVGRDAPSWIAGVGLILQRGVNEGDRVVASDVDGVVERLGLLRLVLRRPDGALTFLAVSALGRDSVTVSSPRRVHPVVMKLRKDHPITHDERQRIKAIAALCPYRAGEGSVRLSSPPDDASTIIIELRAWSADAARDAEAFLHQALEEERVHSHNSSPSGTALH